MGTFHRTYRGRLDGLRVYFDLGDTGHRFAGWYTHAGGVACASCSCGARATITGLDNRNGWRRVDIDRDRCPLRPKL